MLPLAFKYRSPLEFMMNKALFTYLVSCSLLLGSGYSFAAKPEWAGKDKPKTDDIEVITEAQTTKQKMNEHMDQQSILIEEEKQKMKKTKKEKSEKYNKELEKEHQKVKDGKEDLDENKNKLKNNATGLEKQKIKKANQERKEMGKGSEQGQQMREENSKKWWKFWE